ncbi:RHD3/Sey1 [Lyophyllum atratum]|nr:RHD3/Sey1 [Lyophyllum atratum]
MKHRLPLLQISAVALSEFNEQAKSQKRPVESGRVVKGLGALMRNWRTDALTRYDRDAPRYHKGLYGRKRADLLASLDSTLSPLFLRQLKNLHKTCLVTFKKEMLEGLRGESYNFADVVYKAQGRCVDTFSATAQEALVEGTDWAWEDELESLKEEVRAVADRCREDETKKMLNLIEKNFKKVITEPIELALNKANTDMWDRILRTFKETLERAEATYSAKAISFNCAEEESVTSLASLRKRSWLALRAKIEEQTAADPVILGKLRAHFEERFRYDDQGVPRVWKPEDDIDSASKKAKDEIHPRTRPSVLQNLLSRLLPRIHPPLRAKRRALHGRL